MRNETEQTLVALTGIMARRIIDDISPIYYNGPVALSVFNAIGLQLDELDGWVNQLWHEINPLTATWGLDYWEINYNLPYNSELTIEQRRGRVLTRINARAPMNPYRIENIAKGVCQREARVIENTAYRKFDVDIESGENNINYNNIIEAINKAKASRLYFDLHVTAYDNLSFRESDVKYFYNRLICNQFDCGEAPIAGTVGKLFNPGIELQNTTAKSTYNSTACGTLPLPGTIGLAINNAMGASVASYNGLMNYSACGLLTTAESVGLIISNTMALTSARAVDVADYDACGTTIAAGSAGLMINTPMALSATRAAATADYNVCGTLTCEQ